MIIQMKLELERMRESAIAAAKAQLDGVAAHVTAMIQMQEAHHTDMLGRFVTIQAEMNRVIKDEVERQVREIDDLIGDAGEVG